MEPDDLRGRFPMHALATAKAGSLGDERYISSHFDIALDICLNLFEFQIEIRSA